MARIFVAALIALVSLANIEASNVSAQEASAGTSAYTKPSLPAGFFPKYADQQTYASEKVQRLSNNPGYFKDKPAQIAEALAYLEFMIDIITRPNNHQIGAEERQKYFDLRKNVRSKIGIDVNASPSVAIATLYTVSKIDLEALKQSTDSGDIGAILEKQGLAAAEVSSLTEVFDVAGFEVEDVFTVGDAVSNIVSAAGIDGGVADAIVDALGIEASGSFADAVADFNATFGTNYSVEQAMEALGIGEEAEEPGQ